MADLTTRSQRRPIKSREQVHTYEKSSTKEDTITLDLSTTTTTLPTDSSHKREKEKYKRPDASLIGTGNASEPSSAPSDHQASKYSRNTFTAPSTTSHSRRFNFNHNKDSNNQPVKRPQTVSEGGASSGVKWRVKQQQEITNSNSELFARTSFSIANMMDKMQLAISEIEREIKEEQTALDQYKNQMVYLNKKKEEFEKKVETDVAWLKDAESNIATFNSSYTSLFSELGALKIKA
jgi:hypothetical protein